MIANNSPVMALLFSLLEIENTVWRITSFNVNCEIMIQSFFMIDGKNGNSSVDFAEILNLDFPQLMFI